MRLPSLALATAVSLAVLAGCSDDSPLGRRGASHGAQSPPASSSAHPLTGAELDSALLTTDNLSEEFVIDPGDDDSGDSDLGCLFDFETDGPDKDDRKGEIAFSAREEPGLPGVLHFLAAAPTAAKAQKGLDQISDELDDCHHVDTTDDDGTHWELEVSLDRTAWAAHADDQVNLEAIGTMSTDDLELPLTIDLSVVRVGNAVSMTSFFDINDDIGSAHRDITDAATDRLAAVLAGEEPPAPKPVLEGYPIGEAFGHLTESPDIET